MRHLLLAAAVSLSLTGCQGLGALMGTPPPPAQAAQLTVWDEQGAIGVELAYKAARLAMEMAVDGGLLKGTRAATVAELDNKAFAAVSGVRAAYNARNATNYGVALAEARAAVAAMLAAIGR